MSALFPKYHELICDTYTPAFIPGPAPCVLSSGNVSRARLVAGSAFFRSVEVKSSVDVNEIILECNITKLENGPDFWSENVDFKIIDPAGNITIIPTFRQRTETGSCLANGFVQLRNLLRYNPVVNMPKIDVQQPWNNLTDEGCFVRAFPPTKMAGAVGEPIDIPPIRTGPTFTLFHKNQSEQNSDTGEFEPLNEMVEWTGTQWIPHPSTLYHPDNPPPCP